MGMKKKTIYFEAKNVVLYVSACVLLCLCVVYDRNNAQCKQINTFYWDQFNKKSNLC